MIQIYCIKCRLHTDNIDERQEEVTSKGKSRLVMRATCAICSKKKNRFIKTEKIILFLKKNMTNFWRNSMNFRKLLNNLMKKILNK
jgi:hypothetical protein